MDSLPNGAEHFRPSSRADAVNLEKANVIIALESEAFTWFAIQANLSLALKHPQNRGESALFVMLARDRIREALLRAGFLSAEDVARFRADDNRGPFPAE
jgi:hypothetical protein